MAQAKERALWKMESKLELRKPEPALASSVDLASFESLGRSPHLDPEGLLGWTYDTGAAISAFPLNANIGTETQANECSYEVASGELITDHGGLCVLVCAKND